VINDGQDAVVAPTLRESCDQVHRYLGKWGCVVWYRDLVKGDLRPMCKVFVLLTGCAPLDVLFDPGPSSRPAEAV